MQRHERVKTLFLAACELEDAARVELLARECVGDDALRAEVQAMLDFDRRSSDEPLLGLPLRSPPTPETTAVPERIGPFRVVRLVGEGGMGAVYEVEQERPRRRVALKLLRPGLPLASVVRRLQREGELLGRLAHPGIARIHESGQIESPFGPQPYLLMELVRGEPLTRWARTRRATTRQRLELLARVCDAVQHAHEHGVVHRDLKPGNILVEDDGAPKVLDFGIARALDGEGPLATLRTRSGEIVGTLAYMSPEQAGGDAASVDARADVYALGVLLHELLAGELPHELGSCTLPEAVELIRNAEPRRLGEVQREFRGDLETIALKALEKDRTRRYANAAALAADLRRHLAQEPIEARPPTRVYRVRKYVRRHRTPVLAAAAVAVALAGGGAASLFFARGEAAERERAGQREADARTSAYQSGVLAASRLIDDAGFDAARGQLDGLAADLRGWDWGALDRRVARQLAELRVPEVWDATFLDGQRLVAVDDCARPTVWEPLSGSVERHEPVAPGAQPLTLSSDGRRLLAYLPDEYALLLCETLDPSVATRWPLPPGLADGPKGAAPVPVAGWRGAAIDPAGRRFAVSFTDGSLWCADSQAAQPWGRLALPGWRWPLLAFSPDGSRLVGAAPARMRAFDAESLGFLWDVRHDELINHGLVFDDRGSRVFASLGNGVWSLDAETGEKLEHWSTSMLKSQHVGVAMDVALLPRPAPGSAAAGEAAPGIALMSDAGDVWLMDLETHTLWGAFRHPGRRKVSIALAPDGETLLSCGREDDVLRLWTTAPLDSEVIAQTPRSIYPLAVSADGLLVATGAWDGVARLWEIPGGRAVAALDNAARRVEALAISPDGHTLACGLGLEGLATWDLRTGRRLAGRTDIKCGALAWSPDGKHLAAGHGDAVLLLDPATLEERLALRPIGNYTTAVAWSPDGRLVAAGSRNGILSLRDAASGAELARVKGSAGGDWEWTGARALAFSPDGQRLASGWGAWPLMIHDVPGLGVQHELRGHSGEIFGVAWSPDGRRLAAGGRDELLRIWNPQTGSLLLSLPAHEDYIYSLAFTPDGRRLVTGSGDGSVRVWDSARAEMRWRERAFAQAARLELQTLVDGLAAELREASAVAAHLETLPELDAVRRRIALDLLLEREAPPR